MNNVNHPKHYNEHPSGVECIDIVEHFNFNVGNAIKYIWRAGLKSENAVEDLEKANWYIKREIERISKLIQKPQETKFDEEFLNLQDTFRDEDLKDYKKDYNKFKKAVTSSPIVGISMPKIQYNKLRDYLKNNLKFDCFNCRGFNKKSNDAFKCCIKGCCPGLDLIEQHKELLLKSIDASTKKTIVVKSIFGTFILSKNKITHIPETWTRVDKSILDEIFASSPKTKIPEIAKKFRK